MRILVTGSNGLLGQKLTSLLSSAPEIELIVTARERLAFPLLHGEFYPLDITNSENTERVIVKIKPDVVINTAAMTQVDQCETEQEACWKNNVLAVDNVVRACEKAGSHLIHISTDFIFDGTHGPLDESAIPNPISFYGKSKLAGEEIVKKSSLDWTILRTVLVFGVTKDMSRTNIVLWVKKSLEEGKVINVVNDQWRTPTLAEDLAMGCYLAARQKAKGIYKEWVKFDRHDVVRDLTKEIKTLLLDIYNIIALSDSKNIEDHKEALFVVEKALRNLGYRI